MSPAHQSLLLQPQQSGACLLFSLSSSAAVFSSSVSPRPSRTCRSWLRQVCADCLSDHEHCYVRSYIDWLTDSTFEPPKCHVRSFASSLSCPWGHTCCDVSSHFFPLFFFFFFFSKGLQFVCHWLGRPSASARMPAPGASAMFGQNAVRVACWSEVSRFRGPFSIPKPQKTHAAIAPDSAPSDYCCPQCKHPVLPEKWALNSGAGAKIAAFLKQFPWGIKLLPVPKTPVSQPSTPLRASMLGSSAAVARSRKAGEQV